MSDCLTSSFPAFRHLQLDSCFFTLLYMGNNSVEIILNKSMRNKEIFSVLWNQVFSL